MALAPAVSVLVPTRGRPHWVADALRSVVDQTLRDWECIVVINDRPASDRKAYAKALKPFLDDPRFTLIDRPTGGLPQSMNAGLALARGRYVAVLDDDDRWQPRFLEVLTSKLAANPDAAFAWCDLAEVREHPAPAYAPYAGDDAVAALRSYNWITPSQAIVPRSSLLEINGFPEWAGGCDDWAAWLLLTKTRPEIIRVREKLTTKHWHSENMSQFDPAMAVAHAEVRRRIAAGEFDVRPAPSPPSYHRKSGRINVGFVSNGLKSGGAEQWTVDLMTWLAEAGNPLNVVGLALECGRDDRHDPELIRRARAVAPIGFRGPALSALARACDVVVAWSSPDIADYLPASCKLVLSAQGPGWRMVGSDRAAALTAVSGHARTAYPPEFQDRVRIIPNGVDPARVVPTRTPTEMRKELGLPKGAKVVLCVSRLAHEKRPHLLADTIAALPNEWYGVHIGGPDHVGAIPHAAAVAPGRVIYPGVRSDVANFLAIADVFLLPSTMEGHSIALTEAMMAGVPAIATPVGSCREYPGFVRLLLPNPTGDEIAAAILADRADARGTARRVDAARSHARTHWTIAAIGRSWSDLIIEVSKMGEDSPNGPVAEPPLSSLVRRAANFAKAAVKHVASGMPETTDAERAERLATCHSCDRLRQSDEKCGACGCLVSIKSRWRGEDCPIGRWRRLPAVPEPGEPARPSGKSPAAQVGWAPPPTGRPGGCCGG